MNKGTPTTNLSDSLDRLRSKFQRATQFEAMLPGVRFYRFDWAKYVPAGEFDESTNPSFSKASANVNRARGFWSGLYHSLVGTSKIGEANHYNLYDVISQTRGEKLQSVIQFVSMKNEEMEVLQDIAKDALGDKFHVLSLNGSAQINGLKVNGRSVESIVKDSLLDGKPVWIIASNLCQRSFSIPEINCTLLSYDKGDEGATIQRMSRSQTPGKNKTYGHVVSLSIDGNRDDKIATIVLDAAKRNAEKTGDDIVESIKKVLHTLPIFQMVDGDIEALSVDSYSKELFGSSNAHRAIINTDNLVKLNAGDASFELLTGMKLTKQQKNEMVVAFERGKTFKVTEKKQTRATSSEKNLLQLMRENLAQITDRLDFTLKMVKSIHPGLTLDGFFEHLRGEMDLQALLQVSSAELNMLLDEGYLNRDLLAILVVS